nr:MAG TPA_asm: hypothetical protein [Caudoviricetes sp.]
MLFSVQIISLFGIENRHTGIVFVDVGKKIRIAINAKILFVVKLLGFGNYNIVRFLLMYVRSLFFA